MRFIGKLFLPENVLFPSKKILAASCIGFAFGLLHCTFYFFYVKVFLNVYQVTESWFHTSQMIFLVWNALNDPLFGYLLNNPKWRCFRERRLPILYGGPVYALCYLIPWFPWADYSNGQNSTLCGLQLLAALCIYDTLFSYIGLTSCCFTTEMFPTYQERMVMKWYSSAASLLATFSVPFANFASNNLNDMNGLQWATVILACLAALSLWFCGMHAITVYESCNNNNMHQHDQQQQLISASDCCRSNAAAASVLLNITSSNNSDKSSSSSASCSSSLSSEGISSHWSMTRHVLTSRDFLAFVFTNFLQCFHSSYWGSFTNIMVENLGTTASSSAINSFFYWILDIIPTVLFLLFINRLFTQKGYYQLFMWAYRWKVFASCMMFFTGVRPLLFLLFVLQDTMLISLMSRIQDVIMSDITDKIMEENKLVVPQSSVLVGLNALITKPAQSLCPMLAVWVLNRWGHYQEHVKQSVNYLGDHLPEIKTADPQLRFVMFTLCCAIPFVVGMLQCLLWSFFSIRRRRTLIVAS